MWVATKMRFSKFEKLKFQPRNPAGCDTDCREHVLGSLYVSTHAPLRGATFPNVEHPSPSVVSTHAPLRGATLHSRHDSGAVWGFNPRTPAGCDF